MFQSNTITLVGDRRTGEHFPQIRGKFLLVDKCDIPCEISIDGSFYFTAREGLDIRGEFDQIYLRHPQYVKGPDYDNLSDALPIIRIVTSVDSAINNYFSDQYFPCGIPFNTLGKRIIAPIFGNIRYIRPNFTLQINHVTLIGIEPDIFTSQAPLMLCRFYRSTAQYSGITSMGGFDVLDEDHLGTYDYFSHSGNNGNQITLTGKYQLVKTAAAEFSGAAIFDGQEIPVPSGAKYVSFILLDYTFDNYSFVDFNDASIPSVGTIWAK